MMTRTILLLLPFAVACGSQPADSVGGGPVRIDGGAGGDIGVTDTITDAADTRVEDVGDRPELPVVDVEDPDADVPDAPVDDVLRDIGQDLPVAPDVFADADTFEDSVDLPLDPIDDARPDAEPDAERDVVEPGCDIDGDGVIAEACGGTDCDDTNSAIHPERVETCNFHDDDCDGEINEELDCRIYAHTVSQLYLVDPFLGTDEPVTSVPSLFDFDTDPDGVLYGISSSRVLHTFDEERDDWARVGTFATSTGNGFAIDSGRVGYMTAGNNLYTVDLETAEATLVGAMGGGFSSSGDCVVDKSDRLFMTSTGAGSDRLVAVSRSTGEGRLVGSIGYSGLWGLTAAWGHLFGFSSSGQIIEIDPATGAGRLAHTISGRSWYGAASSPGR